MPVMIEAPWTKDQVERLNRYQARGRMHPFTCPNDGETLAATEAGWTCPKCDYTQTWAHAFMLGEGVGEREDADRRDHYK